jgi:hypothetical protein
MRHQFRLAPENLSGGVGERVAATVLQISGLVGGDKLHDTVPKPRGRIERFRPIALKFDHPLFSVGRVHLPGMASAHHSSEKFSDFYRLVAGEVFDLDLKILWQELAHEYGSFQHVSCNHALAEERREIGGASDDTLGVVARHCVRSRVGRRGRNRFLHIHEAMSLGLASIDRDQNRQS